MLLHTTLDCVNDVMGEEEEGIWVYVHAVFMPVILYNMLLAYTLLNIPI